LCIFGTLCRTVYMNTTEIKTENKEAVEQMFSAGAHFGLPKARRHPTVKKYVFGLKQKNDIFDLEKTQKLFVQAKEFAMKLGSERKKILFVGGKPESHAIVRSYATKINAPYCIGRWIGGSLTNNTEIKKRVSKLKRLLEERESGALSKYTKLERLYIDREIEKLQKMYEGLISLNDKLPDALFVIDPKREAIAVEEARARKIPVIVLANSDCDISVSEYPIVANDSSKKSIEYFVGQIVASYEEGVKNAPMQSTFKPREVR
jgi:small subunit ribosomal protein S2